MQAEKITISTTIAADKAKVWNSYTDPAQITQWNFASPDWHCPRAQNDLRVGGQLVSRMEAKDGSFGFDFAAIYEEVVPQQRLTYALEDGRKVTTTFEEESGGTKVTTLFDAEGQHDAEMQRAGWQAILDNFRSHVESN